MGIIPTKYNGYSFRSRTEARWAVFLDEVFIRYEYEKEGFRFKDGGLYLPDFYLPEFRAWVEIKGDVPSAEEINKCRLLHSETKQTVILIYGIPDPNTSYFYVFDENGEHGFAPCRYLAHFIQDVLLGENTKFKNRSRIANAVAKLITLENEYEGDEYAFGQAKSFRFGRIA